MAISCMHDSRDLRAQLDDPAADDYLLLRDHLRVDADDRHLYEATKLDLVTREWSDMNAYADAKTSVIEEIKERARVVSTSRNSGKSHQTGWRRRSRESGAR